MVVVSTGCSAFAQSKKKINEQLKLDLAERYLMYESVAELISAAGEELNATRVLLQEDFVYRKKLVEKEIFIRNTLVSNEEYLRVIQSMPNWIPGKINGKAINQLIHLPVKF